MAIYRFSKVREFQARGGPLIENKKEQKTRTQEGRYVIAIIAKHRSSSRWAWSTVLWDTPLRKEKTSGIIQIYQGNRWVNLSSQPAFAAYKGKLEGDLTAMIATAYNDLKKPLIAVLTSAEINAEIPEKWIFNDFGHLSIKYFKDYNNNYRLDKTESLMTDFVHTVPNDEFFSAHNKIAPILDSHGCIHVHPKDIDVIIGYVKVGSVLQVHSYDEQNIPAGFDSSIGRPMYELHFFPFIDLKNRNKTGTIVLYSVTKD